MIFVTDHSMETLKFSRRQFLAALSLGTGHLLVSNPLHAGFRPLRSEDPFQMVNLGSSGLQTTLLGMGTGVHGNNRSSNLTRQDHRMSLDALVHAWDRGIRMFDLADTYGTHGLMAKAMKSMKREEITLVSKIWVRGGGIPEEERPDADVVVERFLRELGTDYIDLVQIHCMVDEDWTSVYGRQMEILDKMKSKGIIRAHGTSVHSLAAMKTALADPWVDVIHVRINPYGMAMDSPEPADVVSVIHQLHDAGKGLIGMKLVGGTRLRNDSEKIDHTLRFVLGLNSVDMAIIGFEQKEQIDDYALRTRKALEALNH